MAFPSRFLSSFSCGRVCCVAVRVVRRTVFRSLIARFVLRRIYIPSRLYAIILFITALLCYLLLACVCV
jgi:hypothetical protein